MNRRSSALPIVVLIALVGVTLTSALRAQAPSQLFGTWKLNVEKSDFGPMPPTKSQVMTIKDSGDQVDVDSKAQSDMGDMDVHMTLSKTKESVNQLMGMEFHTKLTQTSDGQQEESWADLPDGGKFEYKATSKISDDGKVLTQDVWMKSPMGEANQKLLFDKQ